MSRLCILFFKKWCLEIYNAILNTVNIEIINVIGQTISKKVFTNKQQIELNLNVSKGFYYIKVTENNNRSKTVKIIKK